MGAVGLFQSNILPTEKHPMTKQALAMKLRTWYVSVSMSVPIALYPVR